jgi:hypothetical protein
MQGRPYFVNPGFSEGQPTMLIAGDDAGAKRTVGEHGGHDHVALVMVVAEGG